MLKRQIAALAARVKKLNGDPQYVALGMAIGAFVAVTPTVPFHTILSIGFAFLFRASKPAAYIGMWICNPLTMIPIYLACYHIGYFLFPSTPPAMDQIIQLVDHLEGDYSISVKTQYFYDFMKTQVRTFAVMNVGGVVLGIPCGLAAYILTYNFMKKTRKIMSKKEV